MNLIRHAAPTLSGLIILLMLPLASFAEAGMERIPFWPDSASVDGKPNHGLPAITLIRPDNSNGTAIIICPGGGYGNLVTGPEGTGIARWLSSHGITGVVLEYRLPEADPLRPLSDAQRAIRTVRAQAKKWNLDPKKIGIMGFSAGGHLASTAATHFDEGNPTAADPVERMSSRPDFAILIYPVITMGELTHVGSRNNLLGNHPSPLLVERFSNERQVSPSTPPTFLAHALNDKVVSSENSQLFYEALLKHGVPARYLELSSGGHGLDGYKGPMWDKWQTQSLHWLAKQGFTPNSGSAP